MSCTTQKLLLRRRPLLGFAGPGEGFVAGVCFEAVTCRDDNPGQQNNE
jgi:hypothetical protein